MAFRVTGTHQLEFFPYGDLKNIDVDKKMFVEPSRTILYIPLNFFVKYIIICCLLTVKIDFCAAHVVACYQSDTRLRLRDKLKATEQNKTKERKKKHSYQSLSHITSFCQLSGP